MITHLSVKNFKSLENVSLDFSNLNILTGLNGMGKSSVIQTLLLLRQSFDKGLLPWEGLALNGELTKVGTAKEALFYEAESDEMSLELSFREPEMETRKRWIFTYDTDVHEEYVHSGSDFMPIARDVPVPIDLNKLSLFRNGSFRYLTADRWVRDFYEISDYQVTRNRSLGKNGEYTSHFLSQFGSRKQEFVDPSLVYPGTETRELATQVSAWMSEVSPGIRVRTERYPGMNAVKLSYSFTGRDRVHTPEMSPLNVGFGITYALPIVVALLSSRPNDILIIENPEAHIHPNGQAKLAELMCLTAATGVQIITETHSDHIINGLLIAVKEEMIKPETARVYYTERDPEKHSTLAHRLEITPQGTVKSPPSGFFDQFDRDLRRLTSF